MVLVFPPLPPRRRVFVRQRAVCLVDYGTSRHACVDDAHVYCTWTHFGLHVWWYKCCATTHKHTHTIATRALNICGHNRPSLSSSALLPPPQAASCARVEQAHLCSLTFSGVEFAIWSVMERCDHWVVQTPANRDRLAKGRFEQNIIFNTKIASS